MSNLGKNIARLRKASSMTQVDLAQKLNVTPQAVSKWEKGSSAPDIFLMPKLASALGVTTDEIFGYEPDTLGKEKLFANARQSDTVSEKPTVKSISTSLNEWYILQDTHDHGEQLELYLTPDKYRFTTGSQLSEWEKLPELKQLQLLFADQPYFGRELRYFNGAPWWYKTTFTVDDPSENFYLRFSNVDYYCKVWLNGTLLGEHEGYSAPFGFDLSKKAVKGENLLIVKVWSPFDEEIRHDNYSARAFRIKRNMVKGTYEHSDTFIQRDVNPVGIYGEVTLKSSARSIIANGSELDYTLSDDMKTAFVNISVPLVGKKDDTAEVKVRIICKDTNLIVAQGSTTTQGNGTAKLSLKINDIALWSTWDKGNQTLYDFEITTGEDSLTLTTGFKKTELVRTPDRTEFYINGKRFFVRGTSYFPDYYVSAMHYERYKRDLLAIKSAGFNLIRIHVHIEKPEFYELCSTLGIAIMQDTEYNWQHPDTDEFNRRFAQVFEDNVRLIRHHACIACWVCLNEPGMGDIEKPIDCKAMREGGLGDILVKMLSRVDKGMHPFIKGSFVTDDLLSGDSHNYLGSLHGGTYKEIYGTTEKLNTEFGFDALSCKESLQKTPKVYERAKEFVTRIGEIQDYQYHITKYYIEHYRMQKYEPNAGYGHFLFNDISPNSMYGVYDWHGIPKKGLDAIYESNMPVGIFLRFNGDGIDALFAVNDNYEKIDGCTLRLVLTDDDKNCLLDKSFSVDLPYDDKVLVTDDISYDMPSNRVVHAFLTLEKNGKQIAKNHYHDILTMRPIVRIPNLVSHETGLRMFNKK